MFNCWIIQVSGIPRPACHFSVSASHGVLLLPAVCPLLLTEANSGGSGALHLHDLWGKRQISKGRWKKLENTDKGRERGGGGAREERKIKISGACTGIFFTRRWGFSEQNRFFYFSIFSHSPGRFLHLFSIFLLAFVSFRAFSNKTLWIDTFVLVLVIRNKTLLEMGKKNWFRYKTFQIRTKLYEFTQL